MDTRFLGTHKTAIPAEYFWGFLESFCRHSTAFVVLEVVGSLGRCSICRGVVLTVRRRGGWRPNCPWRHNHLGLCPMPQALISSRHCRCSVCQFDFNLAVIVALGCYLVAQLNLCCNLCVGSPPQESKDMAKQDALENVVELNPNKSWSNIINLALIHILYQIF